MSERLVSNSRGPLPAADEIQRADQNFQDGDGSRPG